MPFGDGTGKLVIGTKCMDKECILPPRSVVLTTKISGMGSARTVENSTFYKVIDRIWLNGTTSLYND